MLDLRRSFGDSAFCIMVRSTCYPKPLVYPWLEWQKRLMRGGLCLGISATTLRFFQRTGQRPADFQSAASTPYDLEPRNIRRHLATYHILQHTNPVDKAIADGLKKTPVEVLDGLRAAISGATSDPVILVMFYRGFWKTTAHAVVPYKIEQLADGKYFVSVYDSEFPDISNIGVVFDAQANTWKYVGNYKGSANSHTLGTVPISIFDAPQQCPWCTPLDRATMTPDIGQISIDGTAETMITNSLGQRLGYVGGEFFNEIAGAHETPNIGELEAGLGAQYAVPLSDTYQIALNGLPNTPTKPITLLQFGPNYGLSISNVQVSSADQETITVTPDGTQIAYSTRSTQAPTLSLMRDQVNASYLFQVKGADVDSGEAVVVRVDETQGTFVFSNAEADGGIYDLTMTRVSEAGNQPFTHSTIPILAGDTHALHYSTWNGTTGLQLDIDHASDGTVDQTMLLDNHHQSIFIPVVSH